MISSEPRQGWGPALLHELHGMTARSTSGHLSIAARSASVRDASQPCPTMRAGPVHQEIKRASLGSFPLSRSSEHGAVSANVSANAACHVTWTHHDTSKQQMCLLLLQPLLLLLLSLQPSVAAAEQRAAVLQAASQHACLTAGHPARTENHQQLGCRAPNCLSA